MTNSLVIIPLVVLFVVVVLSGWRWWVSDKANAKSHDAWFFGAVLLLWSAVFSIGVLGYEIGGMNVSVRRQVEQTRSDVYAAKQDVIQIATSLVKMAHMISDGAGRFGGFPDQHKAKLKHYVEDLKTISPEIQKADQAGRADVEWVNRPIKERSRKE